MLRIAIIGKKEDVKSFMQTYKRELNLQVNLDIEKLYKLSFDTIGIATYLCKEFEFEHLSNKYLAAPRNFNSKKYKAALTINSTDEELVEIVGNIKIARKENNLETIPFMPVTHVIGGPKMSADELRNLLGVLKCGPSFFRSQLPSGKVEEEFTSSEPVESHGKNETPMTVLSSKKI